MVLLLLTFCLLLLPLWESVIVLCFVVRYFMPILVLQSSWWGRESWLLCLICLPGVSWWFSGSSSRCPGVVCSLCCGISWSYSLFLHLILGHHGHASKTIAGSHIVVHLYLDPLSHRQLIKKERKVVKVGPSLSKLFGSAHACVELTCKFNWVLSICSLRLFYIIIRLIARATIHKAENVPPVYLLPLPISRFAVIWMLI